MGFITSRNETDWGQIFDHDATRAKDSEEQSHLKAEDTDKNHIDLGSIELPRLVGMNLGFLGEDEDSASGVEVVIGKSQMQLSAFAAPRSGGYWEEQLAEIQDLFQKQGFSVLPVPGEYGEALLVRPQDTMNDPNLKKALPMLFWGIEKNRSLLRIVFRGAAAENEKDRQPLLPVIENTIINRGESPMAPGDALRLHPPTGLKRIG